MLTSHQAENLLRVAEFKALEEDFRRTCYPGAQGKVIFQATVGHWSIVMDAAGYEFTDENNGAIIGFDQDLDLQFEFPSQY